MLCSTIPSEILLQKSQTCYQPCEQRTCIENCCSSLSYSRSQIFKSLSAEALDSGEVGRSSSHCTVSKLLTHWLHERNIMVIVLHCPVLWCLCAFVLSCCSRVWLFVTLWAIACQAPLSMGILQARILEWVAMPSSRGPFQTRDRTCVSYVSCTGRQVLYL